MNQSFWIAQLIGTVGFIIQVVGIQFDKKERIILSLLLAGVFYCIAYVLLGAMAGAIFSLVEALEVCVNYVIEKKTKRIPIWLSMIYIVACIFFGVLSYHSIMDILVIGAGIMYAIMISCKKETHIRIFYFFIMIAWLIYDFYCRAYVGTINDIFIALSTIIAIYRYDIKKNGNES